MRPDVNHVVELNITRNNDQPESRNDTKKPIEYDKIECLIRQNKIGFTSDRDTTGG